MSAARFKVYDAEVFDKLDGHLAALYAAEGKAPPKPKADELAFLEQPTKIERKNPFAPISGADFIGDLAPREWLVEDVVTDDAEIVAVAGPSKAGKSFALIDLLGAVHRGADWHGHATKKSRVVYVCAEGAGDFRYRLAAYAKANKLKPHELFAVIPASPNLLNVETAGVLAQAIKAAAGADIVCFDTLSATAPGSDQNDAGAMSQYLHTLKEIRQLVGAKACWYSHHTGRDETKGQRGSTALLGGVDAELLVTRDASDVRSISLTKTKAGEERDVLSFRLRSFDLGRDQRGHAYGSAIVETCEAATSRGAKLPAAGSKRRAAYDVVANAVSAAGGKAVEIEAVRAAIVATMTAPEAGKKDRRTARAGEDLDALLRQSLLHKHGDDFISTSRVVAVEDEPCE